MPIPGPLPPVVVGLGSVAVWVGTVSVGVSVTTGVSVAVDCVSAFEAMANADSPGEVA
jgi:hypothetical protein